MANEIVAMDGGISAQDVIRFVESGGAVSITVADEDPATVAARIEGRILNAASVEELFGGGEVIHARDYLNRPFQLDSVEYRPSDIEGEGLPFYGVFHIVTTDGEMAVLTCGARSVLMKAAKAQAEGWLPIWVKITQSDTATAAGYKPLDLEKAPAMGAF